MMLMLSPDPIFNTIISCCLEYQEITIAQLHTKINKSYQLSLAQLYKIIAQLLDKQMLTKSHKKLSLHPLRVANLGVLYERSQHAIQQSYTSLSLQVGENHIWYADTLTSLDNVRNIATHYAMDHSDEQSRYFYNSHPYHVVGMHEIEVSGLQGLSHHGARPIQFIVGNNTWLDQYGMDLLNRSGYVQAQYRTTSLAPQGHFLNVYGDYVIEVVLPLALSNYFDVYFQTVSSLADFPAALFQQLFEFKAPLRVKLSYNPMLAQQYRNQLQSYLV